MFPIRDSIPSRTVPVVTRTLVVINVLVFLFEWILPKQSTEQFIYLFGLVPARYTHPGWSAEMGFPPHNYWPIITHQFLHGGWLHLIFNMWALWIFGDNVEDRLGHIRYLIFYLACGAIAGLTQLLSQPNSTVPSLGASGAIAGVLGAYLISFPTARVLVLFPLFFIPFFFEIPAVIYLVIWFVSQLFSGVAALTVPARAQGIAWWAHIGGFISGMLLCRLFTRRPKRVERFEINSDG